METVILEAIMENEEKVLTDAVKDTEGDVCPESVQKEQVPNAVTDENKDYADISNPILTAILTKIEELQDAFARKIERDTHKERMFDNMHKELIGFQNEVYEKPVSSLALDLIQIIDYIKKDYVFYSDGEITEERYKKLLKCVLSIAQELEDALYRHEIEPYNVPGDMVDTKRQKIISVVDTDDQDLMGKIAERLADGYEKNGKVLRPERIKAYKYSAPKTETTENQ